MTKDEFNVKFDKEYINALKHGFSEDFLKETTQLLANKDNGLSTNAILTEAILVSSEINKKFLYSLLSGILEFDE